ncbi:MAG: hypothetical protein DWQ04_30000 [Chloroflexi bacterium]|nr:MAG: hypothetical protein DWQ04_30000 [Chloroflexota bacterium]
MRRKIIVLSGMVFMVMLAIVGSAASQRGPIAQESAPPIRLKIGTFTPALGETIAVPETLSVGQIAEGSLNYYIVQFDGPITDAYKAQLSELGVGIRSYIPDYAYKVWMTPAQARSVSQLSHVSWVGNFEPAYKLSPDLILDGTQMYRVRLETDGAASTIANRIAATGAQIASQNDGFLLIAATQAQLNAVAQITEVAWVENFVLHEKHNEYGAGVIIGANTANANGYDGSTQIAAVADTGLGGGTAATAHADIPSSRIVDIQDFPASSGYNCYNAVNDGAVDVDSGHGTHTAVSVVGDGDASGRGTGTAPGASLVFQAIEDYVDMIGNCVNYADGYYLLGLPDDLTDLYQPAYNAGARIHSNSWGSSLAGDYTADSAITDQFIWNNPDMLITFSAGNDGTDGNGDGIVDDDSIGSPATAKNVLTVGASENDRDGNWDCDTSLSYTYCAFLGGQNDIFTYGAVWASDFPSAPIRTDPSAGNAEQMAAFSSRGPTDDGRIKPDVVAPGTWILSGYSDLYQEGYDSSSNPQNSAYQSDGWGYPLTEQYKYMGGTSMSNPIVAGAATVVRDYYNKANTHDASAALVKATLINTAVDLLDENNDGADDNDYPIPNSHEGWGLVDLAAATDGSQQYVDNTSGINTSSTSSYQYEIGTGGSPFKVTLVWSDYPSTAAASKNLVNDLNLVVTGPGGSPIYNGNVFSGGWSTTGGSADTVNNVENVYVQSAAAGTWTVEVTGSNVPQGPQPFALVVDGSFGTVATDTPTATNTATPSPTNTATLTPFNTATSTPANEYTPTPTSTSGYTPTPTDTATPTPTNDHTPTPTSTDVKMHDQKDIARQSAV